MRSFLLVLNPKCKMTEEEKEREQLHKKLDLIAFIIEGRLKIRPDREDSWYGDVFDELYDATLGQLELNKKMTEKNLEQTY